MKENFRVRFNPVTKEVEVEGSESFVKTYFDKLQAMMAGSPGKASAVEERPKEAKAAKKKTAKLTPVKKVTHIEAIVTLIRECAEGTTTAALKEKTGLAERQIWNIVNRATKEGRIRKIKRGVYGA